MVNCMDNLKIHLRKLKERKEEIDAIKIIAEVCLSSNFENKIYGGEK